MGYVSLPEGDKQIKPNQTSQTSICELIGSICELIGRICELIGRICELIGYTLETR